MLIYTIHMESRRSKQERIFNTIRREPGIGAEISQYLPAANDRYKILEKKNRGDRGGGGGGGSGGGFLVFPEDKDKICLPTDVFRTNPEPGGCAPFTVPEDTGSCCVQSNLDFCSSVSAIIRGKDDFRDSGGRIVTEMYMWLRTVRADLLPDDKEVDIDTSTNDGKQLLELAVKMSTDVYIHLALHQPNQTLADDISDLRGTVRVYAGANGATINFASLRDIITSGTNLRNLRIDCPVEFAVTDDESAVVDLISETQSFNSDTNMEYSFTLPPRIPVRSVGSELEWIAHWEQETPGLSDGPIRRVDGETVTVTYNVPQNRIFVRVEEQ